MNKHEAAKLAPRYSEDLLNAARILGAKGGQAGTGPSKARTPEQARKAALARWAKVEIRPYHKTEERQPEARGAMGGVRAIPRHDFLIRENILANNP